MSSAFYRSAMSTHAKTNMLFSEQKLNKKARPFSLLEKTSLEMLYEEGHYYFMEENSKLWRKIQNTCIISNILFLFKLNAYIKSTNEFSNSVDRDQRAPIEIVNVQR